MKPVLALAALVGIVVLARGLVADLGQAAPEPRITYYGDGQKKNATEYADGVRSGPSEQWHAGGQREWQGTYGDGYREGEWSFWLQDGSVDGERSGIYRAGKRLE
jgi:antitoxin component YwqK of YwqJK toxin-antitoxin module